MEIAKKILLELTRLLLNKVEKTQLLLVDYRYIRTLQIGYFELELFGKVSRKTLEALNQLFIFEIAWYVNDYPLVYEKILDLIYRSELKELMDDELGVLGFSESDWVSFFAEAEERIYNGLEN